MLNSERELRRNTRQRGGSVTTALNDLAPIAHASWASVSYVEQLLRPDCTGL